MNLGPEPSCANPLAPVGVTAIPQPAGARPASGFGGSGCHEFTASWPGRLNYDRLGAVGRLPEKQAVRLETGKTG
jgi:hypothetical protein